MILTRLSVLVGVRGFEPPTTCTPCRCATRLRYTPEGAGIVHESPANEKTCVNTEEVLFPSVTLQLARNSSQTAAGSISLSRRELRSKRTGNPSTLENIQHLFKFDANLPDDLLTLR